MRLIDADKIEMPADLPYKASVRRVLAMAPTVEAVSKGLYDQIKWERDIAIDQLASYGVSLGEKAELAPVKHGRWKSSGLAAHWKGRDECSECGFHEKDHRDLSRYKRCPNCEAKMDLED